MAQAQASRAQLFAIIEHALDMMSVSPARLELNIDTQNWDLSDPNYNVSDPNYNNNDLGHSGVVTREEGAITFDFMDLDGLESIGSSVEAVEWLKRKFPARE